MFGFIHESLRQLMIRKYGEDFWLTVLKHAGVEAGKENLVNFHYPDAETFKIVACVSELSKMPMEAVWELYGEFFVQYVIEQGWDEMLRCISPDLKGFLNNLDSLHYFIDHVVFKANMRGPSFRCEENADGSIVVHYLSCRSGLWPIVKGILREIARRIFSMEIGLEMAGRSHRTVQMANGERVEEHVVFKIQMTGSSKDAPLAPARSPIPQGPSLDASTEWSLKVNTAEFAQIMPFHLVMNKDCRLLQFGAGLRQVKRRGRTREKVPACSQHIPADLLAVGTPIPRIFEIHRPQIPLDYENICEFINGVFILQSRHSPLTVQQQQQSASSLHAPSRNSHHSSCTSVFSGDTSATSFSGNSGDAEVSNAAHLKLKGQMMLIEGGEQVVYLASPYVTKVAELTAFGLKLSAFAPHDATRDLILMNQQRLSDVEDNRLLDETTAKLNALTKELDELKERTFSLLSESLPLQVVEKLEDGHPVEPQEFEDVTVIFVDIPDLQEMIDHSSADETVAVLAELHQRYDRLVHLHEVVKIEGLNETFVVAAGLPHEHADHAECALHVALGLEYKARLIENPHKKEPLLVRCGVHVGSVVAGVVQVGTPSYCVFGECVQTAARLCAATTAGGILVSDAAKRAAERTARFEFERAPAVRLTAHETLQTHRLKRSFKKSIWEIVNRQRDENINTIDGYEELNKILDANKKNSRAKSNVCNLL